MLQIFHPLDSSLAEPSRFTDPFCYEPHPLCLVAADEVQRYIMSDSVLRADKPHVMLAHRLDTDTSGLLLVAYVTILTINSMLLFATVVSCSTLRVPVF